MKFGLYELLLLLGIITVLTLAIVGLNARKSGPSVPQESIPVDSEGRKKCPHCGGVMTIQTVTEARNAGCLTIILYILLSITILGLLIVIPLILRKKTETVTYAVCQQCGNTIRLSVR